MNHKPLDAEYDFVAILDLLPDTERKQFHISEDLRDLLANLGVDFGIEQKQLNCANRKGVDLAFLELEKFADAGQRFCLHIVSHGDNAGLWLKATDESITWQELREPFSRLNRKLEGNLILNMSSCFGLNGIRIVDITSSELPFFGLVGPSVELEVAKARDINADYYKLMGNGESINKIVPTINAKHGEVLFCITSQSYKHLSTSNKPSTLSSSKSSN